MIVCPCGSGSLYGNCCEPLIRNESASTALELMKSRYTAYCMGEVDYLYITASIKNRNDFNRSEIEQWSKENTWNNLEIIGSEKGGRSDNTGTVEFKAYFTDAKGQDQIHHEKSRFCKENDKWVYIDGIFEPRTVASAVKTSRNSPCPCGSGKKFKNCCL